MSSLFELVVVEDHTADAPQRVRRGVFRALQEGAELFTREAQARAPRKTGYMAEHTYAKAYQDDLTLEALSEAPYASFVNYGTYKMAARPFFTVSMAIMLHHLEAIGAERLQDALASGGS